MKIKIKVLFLVFFFLTGCSSTSTNNTTEQTALKCIDEKNKKEHFFSKKFNVSNEVFLKDTIIETKKMGFKTINCIQILESEIPCNDFK